MTVDLAQQFGASFADGETTIQFDPELAAYRKSAYARANRLTPRYGQRTMRRLYVMSVRTTTSERRRFPLAEFIRASSLHVGAAAAAAALRRDLVETGRLPSAAFDEAYAVARVTPGTNLLAMYALLRFGRPRSRRPRSHDDRAGAGSCLRRVLRVPARP